MTHMHTPFFKTNFRWVVVFLLFLISLLNYMDRASLSYAITLIAKDFSFSASQQGIILSAFGIGYLISTFLGGIAADNYGAKRTLIAGVVFWSVTIVCLAMSNGWWMFLIYRVLFGMAEGPTYPCMSRAISDWLPERERARAFTFSLVSVPLSLGFGGIVVDYVIGQMGWRGCFVILAILTMLWLPLWLRFFTDKPEKNKYISTSELDYIQQQTHIKSFTKKAAHPWRVLFFNPTLISNYFAFFVFTFYLHFFMNWLPSYFVKVQHLEFKLLGIYSFFPWLTAAFLIWLFGTYSDNVFNQTSNLRKARTYPIILSQLLSGLFILGIHFSPSFVGMMICLSLCIGFSMAANAPFYAVNVDIAKERSGSSIGLMCSIGSIGSIISPSVSGYILDLTGSFDMVFYFMSCLALFACVMTGLFHNRVYEINH